MRQLRRVVFATLLVLAMPAAVLAAPPPVAVGVQPSPVAFLQTATNDLYVVGTIRCSRNATVELFTAILQPNDQAPVASRDRTVNVTCGRTPSVWVVRLSPSDGTGTYVPGPAQLSWHWAADGQVFGMDQPIVIVPF